MSTVFNYHGIELQNVKTDLYKEEAVYNGPDYLYTRITLRVTGRYNPSETSYVEGVAVASPGRAGGELPAITARAIRAHLLTPRQKLIYTNGGRALIESPLGILDADSANGPTPVSVEVVEVLGIKTFIVAIAIQTCINDCRIRYKPLNHKLVSIPGPGQVPQDQIWPVLSHTFSNTVEYDQNYFAKTTIKGTVIFDSGLLLRLKRRADEYRDQLLGIPPIGFKRESQTVNISEDGLTLTYVLVDVQQGDTWLHEGTKNIARVQAQTFYRFHSPQFDDSEAERMINVVSEVANVMGSLNPAKMMSPAGAIGGVWNAGVSAVQSVASIMGAEVRGVGYPRKQWGAVVRVWGTPQSTKYQLYDFAVDLVTTLLHPMTDQFHYWTQASSDAIGRFVEIQVQKLGRPSWYDDSFSSGDGRGVFAGFLRYISRFFGIVVRTVASTTDPSISTRDVRDFSPYDGLVAARRAARIAEITTSGFTPEQVLHGNLFGGHISLSYRAYSWRAADYDIMVPPTDEWKVWVRRAGSAPGYTEPSIGGTRAILWPAARVKPQAPTLGGVSPLWGPEGVWGSLRGWVLTSSKILLNICGRAPDAGTALWPSDRSDSLHGVPGGTIYRRWLRLYGSDTLRILQEYDDTGLYRVRSTPSSLGTNAGRELPSP